MHQALVPMKESAMLRGLGLSVVAWMILSATSVKMVRKMPKIEQRFVFFMAKGEQWVNEIDLLKTVKTLGKWLL